jgi:peptide/nickel transport system substrate-binding protein
MSDLSTPDAGTNDTGWSDPDFYKGWKQLDTTRDPSEQTLIVNQMMHIMHDQSPWLMLYFQPDIYGVSNKIQWTPRADEVISLR